MLPAATKVHVGQECDLPLRAEVHVGQVCYLPLPAVLTEVHEGQVCYLPLLKCMKGRNATCRYRRACRAGMRPAATEEHVGQVCYLPLFAKSKIEEYSKHELLKASDTAKILTITKSKRV